MSPLLIRTVLGLVLVTGVVACSKASDVGALASGQHHPDVVEQFPS